MDNNTFITQFNKLKPLLSGQYPRIIGHMRNPISYSNLNKYASGRGPRASVREDIIQAAYKVRQEIINETELTNV